jgi:Guanosine polyphosphate pyrophosphohydrolases/synthetases
MKTQTQLAKEIATRAHEGQTRWDGTPYIVHPAAVAKAVDRKLSAFWSMLGPAALGDLDEDRVKRQGLYTMIDTATATAWLHDVVEDTPLMIEDLRKAGINDRVLIAVDLLTKRDDEEYLAYLLRLKGNEVAKVVKIEDIKNNMSDLDKKRKKSMYEKYQLAIYILESRG